VVVDLPKVGPARAKNNIPIASMGAKKDAVQLGVLGISNDISTLSLYYRKNLHCVLIEVENV